MKKLISGGCRILCTTILFVIIVISVTCSILYLYPDWFLGKNFVKKVNESVRLLHTNRNLFLNGNHPIPNKGPPFVLGNQTRYVGEDAMFSCGMSFDGSVSEMHNILWLKNYEAVVNGTNHYITWEVANHSDSKVNVTTNLTIYSVTEDDFGMYLCYIIAGKAVVKPESNTKQKPKPKAKTRTGCFICCCVCPNSVSVRQPELSKEDIALLYYELYKHHWIGEFHLLREKPRNKTLFIVPGTLVTLAVYFRHLREIDDFSIRFTRSGEDIQSFDTQCSYSARAYASLIHILGISVAYNNVTYVNDTSVDLWKGSIGIIWTCITPSMYGVYQITILRKVHNKHDEIQWIEKIDYPTKVYIKPKDSSIVTENMSINKNRAVVVCNQNCWSDEEPKPEGCDYIDTLVESIFDRSILYETGVIKNVLILLLVVFVIIGLLQFCILPYIRCKVIQLYCIVKMSGKEPLAGIEVNPDIQYHLYISSSSGSEDRSFIKHKLLPILKPLDLKVFCGQDDILPGGFELSEMSNAINKSLKCLVIVSKRYAETSLQNHFEMNCILGKFSDFNLAIINLDNCQVNKTFDNISTVINCSRDGLSERDKTVLMQCVVKHIPPMILKSLLSSIMRVFKYIFRCIINTI